MRRASRDIADNALAESRAQHLGKQNWAPSKCPNWEATNGLSAQTAGAHLARRLDSVANKCEGQGGDFPLGADAS